MIEKKELFEKCLNITGAFEGASWTGSAGNFDGAGISAFILQWNFKSILPQILMQMYQKDNIKFEKLIGEERAKKLTDLTIRRAMQPTILQDFVLEATTGSPFIIPPGKESQYFQGGKLLKPAWKEAFALLGENFKDVQIEAAQEYFDSAIDLFKKFELKTERGLAFCFDQVVQRGKNSLANELKKKESIQDKYSKMGEREKLLWILKSDLQDFPQQWREDVNARRLCIIEGYGMVHRTHYNLEKMFGLTDSAFNFS